MLEDIRTQLKDLIVVCNGILSEDGRKILEKYADQIIIRPNTGYDAGAYQEMIKKIYDEGIIDNYDELLLFNDTFFGPFYPFKSIFSAMKEKDADFGGFIVSDEHYKVVDYEGVKVYKLSQIGDRQLGMVVALNAGHTEEVRNRLKSFRNVLYLWEHEY